MSDLHIDDFYRDAAKILVQLYGSFPRKTILYVEDIAGPDTPDEFGLHSERHQAAFGAMIWLAESGYLRYADTIRQEALDQVILSHKAFTLLSARATHIPAEAPGTGDNEALPASVLESSRTNIAQLRQALKSGSSTVIRQLVQQLMLASRHHHSNFYTAAYWPRDAHSG